jgi:CheY-like chemotaxis protein
MAQRLLVVDSDRRFIQDHQAVLEATFDVDFLHSTEGALARLESGQYAAVLLCVEVSENKGYSLCSAIRKAPATQGIKIALISGKATAEEYARHQSLKGRADLYLHKPIAASALVSALSPFVPMKIDDPDNPLGDLGEPDVADEWLASLKTELDLDLTPRGKAAPAAAPAAPAASVAAPDPSAMFSLPLDPLPLAHQATLKLSAPSKDAGKVLLLESRVQDLETKLVAKADQLDQTQAELEEMRRIHETDTRNLGDQEQLLAEVERQQADAQAQQAKIQALEAQLAQAHSDAQRQAVSLSQAQAETQQQSEALDLAQAELQRRSEELEGAEAELRRQTQALDLAQAEIEQGAGALASTKAQLAEQGQLTMDTMESNLLLQAQLEEAREKAAQHHETERSLEAALDRASQLEARLRESEAQLQELQDRYQQQEISVLEMEAKCGECQETRERLQDAFAELEGQVAALEANHKTQQLELLSGIDERDGQLGRLNATLDAQQERLLGLERQKGELEDLTHTQADRMRDLHELLADLAGKARQAFDLSKSPSE